MDASANPCATLTLFRWIVILFTLAVYVCQLLVMSELFHMLDELTHRPGVATT